MSREKDLAEIFLRHAAESGDQEQLTEIISTLQGVIVPLFALYILTEANEHKDHDKDCPVMDSIPSAIDAFCSQFTSDLRLHVELNLAANGFTLNKTTNQKTYEEILKSLNQAE